MKNHPTESELALYAGGDLGFWETRAVHNHVSACEPCRQEVLAFQQTTGDIREVADRMPGEINWTRLSQEITGNIRVGLAAGEAIEGFERHAGPRRPRLTWNALVLGGAMLGGLGAFWISLPHQPLQHWASALGQIRWNRIGVTFHSAMRPQDSLVLEASPVAIEVKVNGHALSLMHPHSAGGTVSMNMQDSAGVRYVDDDTGQVTINKVYYAQ